MPEDINKAYAQGQAELPCQNLGLYNASLKALTEHGVPQELAQKVSKIVASDEPGKPNMGRTPQDQEAVNEAMQIFWRNRNAQ